MDKIGRNILKQPYNSIMKRLVQSNYIFVCKYTSIPYSLKKLTTYFLFHFGPNAHLLIRLYSSRPLQA